MCNISNIHVNKTHFTVGWLAIASVQRRTLCFFMGIGTEGIVSWLRCIVHPRLTQCRNLLFASFRLLYDGFAVAWPFVGMIFVAFSFVSCHPWFCTFCSLSYLLQLEPDCNTDFSGS